MKEIECPYCKKVYYKPSGPVLEGACKIAFGMHLANCPKDPDKELKEYSKLLDRLLESAKSE